jgi:protocatechuate 3,4-dioxygenase beta subunit
MNRRTFLVSGTAALSALRAMPSTPACTLTAEQEEGPYYVDYGKMRSDITEGKTGTPLRLRIALLHAKRCAPLADASLDIWHCDAEGIYSGFTANHGGGGPGGPGRGPGPGRFPGGPPPGGFGQGPPPGGPRGHHAMDATRFLRGVQSTDSSGMVEFATIYPGWYEGRAIHIHVKVHAGGQVVHTGQLFFPEEVTARMAQLQPYAKHRDVHLTTLGEDHVFEEQHGAMGMVALNRVEPKSDAAGFVATVTLAVDPEATPEPVGMRGPRG